MKSVYGCLAARVWILSVVLLSCFSVGTARGNEAETPKRAVAEVAAAGPDDAGSANTTPVQSATPVEQTKSEVAPAAPTETRTEITDGVKVSPSIGEAENKKSPTIAVLLPLGGGAALIGLAALCVGSQQFGLALVPGVAALVVSPAFGQFYVGNIGKGLITSGLRVGGVALLGVGVIAGFSTLRTISDTSSRDAIVLASTLSGLAILGGTSIFDLYDAYRTVAPQDQGGWSFSLLPTLYGEGASATGKRVVPGLAVVGSF